MSERAEAGAPAMVEIEVDEEVLDVLKGMAEPFVDTPNTVLQRLFGLDGSDGASSVSRPRSPIRDKGGGRASPGSILSEREYEIPILRELLERGGSADATAVTEAVGEQLRDRFTELDEARLDSGEIRWRNRVHFTRLRLRQLGLLEPSRRRGVWELSPKGQEAAEAGEIST